MKTVTRHALALALAALPLAGVASEFRSVGEAAAILYDAPSAKANKLYIVNRGYPVDVLVVLEGWAKVRDANGDLAWIETRHLSEKRMVMIVVPLAQIRQRAAEDAPLVFQARQNVLLEAVGTAGAWLRVRHEDGAAGYVKATQVWGA